MRRSLITISLISVSGMLLSGCGAIMKPLFKVGFKALSQSGDEIVSGAAKGIGKSSDIFTKGITKTSDNLYTSPPKNSLNKLADQPSITSKPLRVGGRELIRDSEPNEDKLYGGWLCNGIGSDDSEDGSVSVRSYTSETWAADGTVKTTGTMWMKIYSNEKELIAATYSIRSSGDWELNKDLLTTTIKSLKLSNISYYPSLSSEEANNKRKEIDDLLDIDNLVPVGTISTDRVLNMTKENLKLVDSESNESQPFSMNCKKKR